MMTRFRRIDLWGGVALWTGLYVDDLRSARSGLTLMPRGRLPSTTRRISRPVAVSMTERSPEFSLVT